MKELFSKILSTFISVILLVNSFAPSLAPGNITKPAYAEENSCTNEGIGDLRNYLATRVGGIALDRAAVFLADMSDITGAYYDQSEDKIVFVGTKGNVSLPKFEKDDLAVAIRAIVFNNTVPSIDLSYENETNPYGSDLLVTFRGGLEDTKFGSTILDADYKYKLYLLGHNENGQRIISSVPGYKSYIDRVNEKVNSLSEYQYTTGRFTILPDKVSLKRDSSTSSFVFDEVKMRTEYEFYQPTPQAQHEAATEFTQHMTQNYDLFSEEIPSYKRTKQLAKIVGVVKWMKDNNIVNNFEWAREDQSEFYPTPRRVKSIYSTPFVDKQGKQWIFSGGTSFTTPNTYLSDTGIARSIKNSSESVPSSSTDTHWSFSNGGVQYEAVAVEADAFRNIGAYHTSVNDVSFPTLGDQSLSFYRSYSSFSGGQKGLGRGWDFMPVRLYDNKPNWFVNCTSGTVGKHPSKLGFLGPDGLYESFDYSCSAGYSADKPEYHSKITHNSDGTFTVKLTSQTEYIFDSSLKLIFTKDKTGNKITYSYDLAGKLISIADLAGHSLRLGYNPSGLVSSVSDWTGRSVRYGYDIQSNLTSVTDPRGNITRYEYDGNNKLSKVINRLGQVVTENTYTPEAKIATQKDAAGTVINFTYDEALKTVSAIDNSGRTGLVKYDDKARVVENTDPSNNVIKYTYGTEYSPLTVTDKKSFKYTYTYDASGNTTSLTFPTGKKIIYQYDAQNRLIQILDGRYGLSTKNTSFTYDSKGNVTQRSEAGVITNYAYTPFGEMSTLTDPLNQKTTWTRDSFGNPLTASDNLGDTTSYQYDSLAHLTRETDPEGKTVSYSYDANNNLINVSNSSGSKSLSYDSENRATREVLPNNAATDYVYNNSGLLASVRDPLNNTTSYGYDSYKNLVSKQDALQKSTAYSFDNMDRQTQRTTPLGQITRWEYDQNGNITKLTNADASTAIYTYDSLNRVTKVTYSNGTSAIYAYDDRNNLTKISDSSGSTSFTYDTFDRITKVTNPYSRSVSYAYDNADNLKTITYPDSRKATYAYDGSNRLTGVSDWNSSNTTYTFNKNGLIAAKNLPNGISATYTYDGSNRLMGITYSQTGNTLAKFSYQRDSVGNITQAVEEGSFFTSVTPSPTPTNLPSPTPTAVPTNTPAPTSIPTPTPTLTPTNVPTPAPSGTLGPDLVISNLSITPAIPALGARFTINVTITNQGNTAISGTLVKMGIYYDRSTPPGTTGYNAWDLFNLNYLPAGQSATWTYPYASINSSSGIHNLWIYVDVSNKFVELNENNNIGGPLIFSVAYGVPSTYFAKLGIMPAVAALFSVPKASAQTVYPQFVTNFGYDAAERITSAQYPNNISYLYGYDAVDNRISQTANGQNTSYLYNSDDQLTQAAGINYSYSAEGELVGKTGVSNQTFSYDPESRLTSFTAGTTTTSYKYDNLGNRLEKKVGRTTTRFVNDLSGDLATVLAETNSLNTIQNWYLYGIGLISQGSNSSSNRLYPLTDGLGNVRFVTNYAGSQVKRYDYDPFGNVISSSGPNGTNYEFSSEQLDPESGMYYLRARYYDPDSGRFISRDPIRGLLDDPQSQNPYVYSLNNPVNFSDPSGEQVAEIAKQCLMIAGRITGYTAHGLEQAMERDGGRGVNPGAMLNAVKNPVQIKNVIDTLGRESTQYIGEKATVVLNELGQIISTWGQPRNPAP